MRCIRVVAIVAMMGAAGTAMAAPMHARALLPAAPDSNVNEVVGATDAVNALIEKYRALIDQNKGLAEQIKVLETQRQLLAQTLVQTSDPTKRAAIEKQIAVVDEKLKQLRADLDRVNAELASLRSELERGKSDLREKKKTLDQQIAKLKEQKKPVDSMQNASDRAAIALRSATDSTSVRAILVDGGK